MTRHTLESAETEIALLKERIVVLEAPSAAVTHEERARKLLEFWDEQPMPQHVLAAQFAEVETAKSWGDLGPDDLYPSESPDIYTDCDGCRACGKPLFPENRRIADGCPCNSGRGINHGLVATNTCTCSACDPAQTGGTRQPIRAQYQARIALLEAALEKADEMAHHYKVRGANSLTLDDIRDAYQAARAKVK
jgi:hypothetical protein